MRRKDKEITERSQIEAVIRQSIICRLGMADDNIPYIVPLCFGYRDNALYIHGAPEGKKIEILKKNQDVCFEFDLNTELVEAESACSWSMKYQSVIGCGKASFLEDPEEKRQALEIIMNQYSDKSFRFPEEAINKISVIKIAITSMTGKQSGFK